MMMYCGFPYSPGITQLKAGAANLLKSLRKVLDRYPSVTLRKSTCINLMLLSANLVMLGCGHAEIINLCLDVASNMAFDILLTTTGLSSLPWLQEDGHHTVFEVVMEIII